jgi:hypothetical protein
MQVLYKEIRGLKKEEPSYRKKVDFKPCCMDMIGQIECGHVIMDTNKEKITIDDGGNIHTGNECPYCLVTHKFVKVN